MNKIKLFLNFKNIYLILLIYFFIGYVYPNFLYVHGVYNYIYEYLGIYEKVFWIFLIGYVFSIFMKNPVKKIVLRVRLCFMMILSVATGYLYLLENLKNMEIFDFREIQDIAIHIGLLNINLGYIELYTFLKIFQNLRKDVFLGALLSIIFISLVVICGKTIRGIIMFIINSVKKYINHLREQKRLKEEQLRLERQAKLERDIYEEICNIQKIYQEKDEAEVINEQEDEIKEGMEDDISIEISEEEGDTSTTGIPAIN